MGKRRGVEKEMLQWRGLWRAACGAGKMCGEWSGWKVLVRGLRKIMKVYGGEASGGLAGALEYLFTRKVMEEEISLWNDIIGIGRLMDKIFVEV